MNYMLRQSKDFKDVSCEILEVIDKNTKVSYIKILFSTIPEIVVQVGMSRLIGHILLTVAQISGRHIFLVSFRWQLSSLYRRVHLYRKREVREEDLALHFHGARNSTLAPMCVGLLPGLSWNTWPSLFCLFLAWIWSLVAKQTLVGAKIRQPNCDKTYLPSTKKRRLFKKNWINPWVNVSHMYLSSLFLLCKIWTTVYQLIRLHSGFQSCSIATAAQFYCKRFGLSGEEFGVVAIWKLLTWMVKSSANRWTLYFLV